MTQDTAPKPLDAANVVYDALAARQGFKRQPGTRERLTQIAESLVGMKPADAMEAFQAFGSTRQQALMLATGTVGAMQLGQTILKAVQEPDVGGMFIAGIPFDFSELE